MNRREWQRRQQRKESAERYAREAAEECSRDPEARPSDYGIRSLDDALRAGTVPECVLYCRVSDRKQHVQSKVAGCRRLLAERCVKLARSYGETASGKSLAAADRPTLHEAVQEARRLNVPLVVPCTSRIVRNPDYHAFRQPDARPTVSEFERFLKLAEGVRILTLNDPDASCPDDEAFLRKLTADVEGRRVGRPRNKPKGSLADRRDRWQPRVGRMHAKGMSYRKIAIEISRIEGSPVSYGTVAKWDRDGAGER
jgi:hypothetical protein